MLKDYYKILAIPNNAKLTQIKQNTKTILYKTKKEYATNLQEIKKAYSIISNPKSRTAYDSKSDIRYYQILRIGINTEQKLIKNLAQNTVNVVKKEYENQVAEIKEAYFILSNPEQRATYDDAISQQEYKKLQRKLQRSQKIEKRKFPLTRLVFSIFLISLVYFGYTNYQNYTIDATSIQTTATNIEATEKKQALESVSFTPLYEGEPTDEVTEQSTKISKNVYKSFSPTNKIPNIDYKAKSEDILAAEKQPDSLGYYGWEDGAAGYDTVMSIANSGEEPVIIYFYTDWCKFCRKLEDNYFADYQIEKFLHTIPKVKINPETGDAEDKLFNKYGGSGYPSVFVYVPAFENSSSKKFTKSWSWSTKKYMNKLRTRIIWEYTNHASIQITKEQYDDARYYYRKALLYNSENANAYYRIGYIYHIDGHKKRDIALLLLAKQNYLEALTYEYDHKPSQKNLKILGNL